MKTQISSLLSLSTLLFAQAAMAESYPNYQIKLDWSDESTLEDGITQQCDDTYYPAVEIIVPGKAGEDFHVQMDVDITRGELSPACDITFKQGRSSATYKVNASGGACTIRIDKYRRDFSERPQHATYDINDAC